ncbi:MAG: hypothetical protein GYB65_19065, partial [Chloroflexi bacterium]|nr:hypothetical protein [Chloroflexota bacterium]
MSLRYYWLASVLALVLICALCFSASSPVAARQALTPTPSFSMPELPTPLPPPTAPPVPDLSTFVGLQDSSLDASGVIAFSSRQPSADDIYVMNLDGTELRRLTEHLDHAGYPAYSPDGTRIAYYVYHG